MPLKNEVNMTIEISILIAIVGCFVGLAGFLRSRDGKIATDSEWKGEVNTQLRTIIDINTGVRKDVEGIETRLGKIENRVSKIESRCEVNHVER